MPFTAKVRIPINNVLKVVEEADHGVVVEDEYAMVFRNGALEIVIGDWTGVETREQFIDRLKQIGQE